LFARRAALSRTSDEVSGHDEIVALRDIPFESHCEHHLAPIMAKRTSAIYRDEAWSSVFLSLARLVDVYAKRLQIREKMIAEIAIASTCRA
jgi:GTP cyclohydrolase IA